MTLSQDLDKFADRYSQVPVVGVSFTQRWNDVAVIRAGAMQVRNLTRVVDALESAARYRPLSVNSCYFISRNGSIDESTMKFSREAIENLHTEITIRESGLHPIYPESTQWQIVKRTITEEVVEI